MTDFIPYIEAHLTKSCTQPIFARIFTHHFRKIQLNKADYTASNHLHRISFLVREHYKDYETKTVSKRFPIDRYHYFIAPNVAWRINSEGCVLGIFNENECKPEFTILNE